MYQDAGEMGDWKKLFSVYNTRYIVNDYPNGAEVALKVHELGKRQDYEIKDVSLVEIKAILICLFNKTGAHHIAHNGI